MKRMRLYVVWQMNGEPAVVKSKSMTTEEIHLNDSLEAAGLQVIETDLGDILFNLPERRLRTSLFRLFTNQKAKSRSFHSTLRYSANE